MTIQEQDTTGLSTSDVEMETSGGAFRALYQHWEAHQWSIYDLDFTEDKKSFDALDDARKEGFIWMFGHRFHAEFGVATLLAPFLLHAPTYDMQLMIATQVADEHRHLECVLRIYDEVFGIKGIENVKKVADAHIDLVGETLFTALDEEMTKLVTDGSPARYLRSVVGYHLLGEGVVARCAQHLAADVYDEYGSFPGLKMGQRLVSRDEARHIGIGVTFVRQQIATDPERNKPIVEGVLNEFADLASDLLGRAVAADMHDQVRAGYNVEPIEFYNEAVRLLQIRMRSVGFLTDDDD